MMPKLCLRRAVAAVLVSSAVASAAPPPEQAELAERLLQSAQRLVTLPAGRSVAAALADVSERLFENDARLLRTAADLRLSLGDRDRALALLTAYRKLDPADQIAQVQFIDLQQSKLESATERADYLTRIAASDRLPAEVRSHAATLLAAVEIERGRDDAANAAVAQALGFNPLNPKALQMRADAAAATGNAAERVASLVGLLKANPLQFPTASRLGEELLRAGLTEQAGELYRNFLDAVAAAGYGPGAEDSIHAAMLMQFAGRDRDAVDVASAAMKDDPADMRLHGLRLLLARAANDEAGYTSALDDARKQATRNLMGLHVRVDPKAPRLDDATPVALPDVRADATALKAGTDTALANEYLRALNDLAWLESFYAKKAPDAAVLEAVNTVAGVESPLAHRLAGFAALASDRLDEADVALTPVANADPLARLGLLVLRLKQGKDKATVLAEAGKLTADLPTDVWPMVIRQAVKDAGVPTFRAVDANAVAGEYAKLPKDILNFASAGRSFYLVDVDPMGGSVELGAPILVRVTLQNVSPTPLAIGPGGAIAQQVAIDATVRGLNEQPFPAVAIARLTQRLVVPPRTAISTVVRLDSGELSSFLSGVPQAGAAVLISGVTNPTTRPDGGVVPGPGGYRAQGRGVIDRPQVAFNRPDTRDALIKQLAAPDPVRRLRAVAAVGACARFLAANGTNDEAKTLVVQAAELLTKAAESDASSTVRANANQELAYLAAEDQRAVIVEKMINAKDLESRVMGALMTTSAKQFDRATLLKTMLNDADPVVKALATALLELPDPAAPTAPAADGAAPTR